MTVLVLGPLATVLSVAIPVGIFLVSVHALYAYLARFDRLHIWLLLATAAVIAIAVGGAMAGVGMTTCLVIVMLAPAVTVIGYEISGHRLEAEVLAEETLGAVH